jgi:gas vesicle protein
MSDNTKFITGLLIGAAAGAALAIFFSSDKGKEILEDAKQTVDDITGNIKETAGKFEDELHKIIDKGRSFLEEWEQKATDATA